MVFKIEEALTTVRAGMCCVYCKAGEYFVKGIQAIGIECKDCGGSGHKRECGEAYQALKEIEEYISKGQPEKDLYVPDTVCCFVCNFSLVRVALYVNTGVVGSGGNHIEPCPNGCGELSKYSWKELAKELGDRLDDACDENKQLKQALEDKVYDV